MQSDPVTSHSPSHCLSSLTIAFMPSCLLILSLPIHAPHCPHTLKSNIPMHYYPPTMCNGVAHSPQHSVLIPTSVFSMVRWTPLPIQAHLPYVWVPSHALQNLSYIHPGRQVHAGSIVMWCIQYICVCVHHAVQDGEHIVCHHFSTSMPNRSLISITPHTAP